MSENICPDCGRPFETHAMFSPPRCPVVRIKWEPIHSWWGESILAMRYIAFGPQGQLSAWPQSRLRRAWMRLGGWTFVEESAIEAQRRLNWLRQPVYEASVERLSVAEIQDRYGKGPTS